jgi:hypothetical protein
MVTIPPPSSPKRSLTDFPQAEHLDDSFVVHGEPPAAVTVLRRLTDVAVWTSPARWSDDADAWAEVSFKSAAGRRHDRLVATLELAVRVWIDQDCCVGRGVRDHWPELCDSTPENAHIPPTWCVALAHFALAPVELRPSVRYHASENARLGDSRRVRYVPVLPLPAICTTDGSPVRWRPAGRSGWPATPLCQSRPGVSDATSCPERRGVLAVRRVVRARPVRVECLRPERRRVLDLARRDRVGRRLRPSRSEILGVIATHRWSALAPYGAVLEPVVRHRCDVRCCVRPDHLVVGTQAQNVAPSDAAAGRVMHGPARGSGWRRTTRCGQPPGGETTSRSPSSFVARLSSRCGPKRVVIQPLMRARRSQWRSRRSPARPSRRHRYSRCWRPGRGGGTAG